MNDPTPSAILEPPPRRFRRRLLLLILAVGLLPALAWGLAANAIGTRLLSLSLGPVEAVLEQLDSPSASPQVRQARLDLAQAEVARRSLVRFLPRVLTGVLVLSALGLIFTAVFVGRRLSRPVETLAEGMARYARGDLAHRLPEPRGAALDELQYLVRAFNRMGDELAEQRARLEVTEALAAWQGAARVMSHELRNPLTAMRMSIGRLLRTSGESLPAEAATRHSEALGLIETEIGALLAMAETFSRFAKLPAPVLQPAGIAELVQDVCNLYRPEAPSGLELAPGPSATVLADAPQMREALGNLVRNAIQASGATDGPVRVTWRRTTDRVEIEVLDDGPGIRGPLAGNDLIRSLGSTRPGGSGLGLPIVHKIIHDHGGTVRLDPLAGRGTRAAVILPEAALGTKPPVGGGEGSAKC